MRRETDGKPPKNFVYPLGVSSYTHDHWLYVIDDDGLILGSHPEVNVDGCLIDKAGENDMASENPRKHV